MVGWGVTQLGAVSISSYWDVIKINHTHKYSIFLGRISHLSFVSKITYQHFTCAHFLHFRLSQVSSSIKSVFFSSLLHFKHQKIPPSTAYTCSLPSSLKPPCKMTHPQTLVLEPEMVLY